VSGAGITILGASAGSGKTYRLTQEVIAAVTAPDVERVPVEALFAVTYTKKAQAELAARIRHALIQRGAYTEASRLPLAYLGTVHAACLRLLQEFALDVGLSPSVDVVAGDEAKLLREALDAQLPPELKARIERLAARLQLRIAPQSKRCDWITPVGDVMDLARGNRIAPGTLPAMAERSADGLLALLMPPKADGLVMDEALARELAHAQEALVKANDDTGLTKKVLGQIVEARARLEDRELDWRDWAKLSGIEPSKRCEQAVARLREVAAAYEAHPRLHVDVRALTHALFEAARIGLTAYADWKTERRVVDYVDMLDGGLRLVEHPRVASELAERLRFAVVDEFQDTSPIQLALFVRLHALAGRSVWVGDRKQCIFEYAGADPLLMDAVAGWVAESGGKPDVLPGNYRARPELVDACSELFTAALGRHGFSRAEVAVSSCRRIPAELSSLPPMALWLLEGKNKDQDAACMAAGIARLLAAPEAYQIEDRASKQPRGVRPGDIAVLVATNNEAARVAAALHARGIRVAVARAGLLQTPEGMLVAAALRFMLDEQDTLSAAILDALHGELARDPDAWLSARVRGAAPEPSAWRSSLESLRAQLGVLSPAEAVEGVLAALDVVHLAARWPDAPQRVANLDALRALAEGYQERCAQGREAASVAGLLRYFDDMATERLRRDEQLASDDQHVPTDEGAVVVCTYHKAKGLEWPVVILGSLDREERRHAFEVSPETERARFDPEDPLGGRWIRYWPWPFGGLKDLPLRDKAAQSDAGRRVAVREERERARLLYVGFTRARDHLVLAVRVRRSKTATTFEKAWLDELAGTDGEPLLQLPTDAADRSTARVGIRASGEGRAAEVGARVFHLAPTHPAEPAAKEREVHRWFVRSGPLTSQPPRYRIIPSQAEQDWPELALPSIRAVTSLSGAMPVQAKVAQYDTLGDAVHAYLAVDTAHLAPEERVRCATRLLQHAGLAGVIDPDALIDAEHRLRELVVARWGEATWHREVPIEASIDTPHGARRVVGTIDLLLETSQGYVIVDHKTFPGRGEPALRMKTREFLPQLAAYADAMRRVPGARVVGCWVHFPVGGAVVELCV
jgi:ATP-dependent helicase/nuclease subunit A